MKINRRKGSRRSASSPCPVLLLLLLLQSNVLPTSSTSLINKKVQRQAQENSNETWITLTSGAPASMTLPPALAPIINGFQSSAPTMTTITPVDETNSAIIPVDETASEPTGQPTMAIVIVETSEPTTVPTAVPTAVPTTVPTAVPTAVPTTVPTTVPTAVPTTVPTMQASGIGQPTIGPTESPTTPPAIPPTLSPTPSPTVSLTRQTTSPPPTTPSASSTPTPIATATLNISPLITQTVPGLSIGLQPLTPLNATGITAFEKGTDTYYDYFYNRINTESFSELQTQVTDVKVQTKVIEQTPAYSDGGRRLQMQQITYEQRVSYRTVGGPSSVSSQEIVLNAMNSKVKREVYLVTLQVQSPETFSPVNQVYMVEFSQPPPTGPAPTSSPPAETGLDTSTIAIISVVCSLVLLFSVLGGVWFYRKSRTTSSASASNNDKNSGGGGYRSNDDGMSDDFNTPLDFGATAVSGGRAQNSNIRVPSSNYVDEVSTLAEPMPRLGVMSSGDISYAGYEDKSIATVDYDYSKAYGGTGGTSFNASSFSQRQHQAEPQPSPVAPPISPPQHQPPQSSFSVFSDDASFDAHYQEPYKEQTLEVLAPAGKLGVVIDTPDEGAPIVHAVKETSCVVDKLKVGDKLIRVDEEDVTAMTAIKVSKLISRKSANAVRKLTIVRTIVADS